MSDLELASLLRRKGITDERVLEAIRSLTRADFVPPEFRDRALVDSPLPIGHAQTISQPYIVALMTQAIAPSEGMRVLEVGTGSGYQAAVLSKLGCEVFSIEVVPELARSASERLAALRLPRLHIKEGDGWAGWPEEAPFDAILLTAAPRHVPLRLLSQLRPGGRMVAPIGEVSEGQQLMLFEKHEDGTVEREVLLPVQFVPMVGGEPAFA